MARVSPGGKTPLKQARKKLREFSYIIARAGAGGGRSAAVLEKIVSKGACPLADPIPLEKNRALSR